MQQARHRRFGSFFTAAALVVLSAGAGALPFIEFDIPLVNLDPDGVYLKSLGELGNTGFSIRSRDGSALTINSGFSKYDPAAGLQSGQRVQDGFVLLDGTLSLDIDAKKLDGTRARLLTTYRLDVRRRALRTDHLARALVRRGLEPTRARTRARAMRLDDARVMRLVERRDGSARWIRAVRTIRETRARTLPARTLPDGVLGHFGFVRPKFGQPGDPYVWAVMDRNSQYAVGVTVDRDRDGVPNSADNCVGSANSNQSDADADHAGDTCDTDDDNDAKDDEVDNCPLAANTDQSDQDFDGAGDACDTDDDGDAVSDDADACLATALGSLVNSNGCSIADTCPCESSWRNHGAYVKCVAQTSGSFLSAGLMTSAQKDAIVSAGAQSSCGF